MICPVARLDVIVDHEPFVADWAVPDFMITFALAHEGPGEQSCSPSPAK
jgi:hypothetical protein